MRWRIRIGINNINHMTKNIDDNVALFLIKFNAVMSIAQSTPLVLWFAPFSVNRFFINNKRLLRSVRFVSRELSV